MRAVVQRVASAKVTVEDKTVGAIGKGLLVYLGVGAQDEASALEYMVDKVLNLRVFPDEAGKMNLSVLDAKGGVLVVSQFTLYGDVRRGRRPGFDAAMEPVKANEMYEAFVARVRTQLADVATGEFRAHMIVDAQVDGPITILVDSSRTF
jgi:D-aminoacyl-tRNA deacylase